MEMDGPLKPIGAQVRELIASSSGLSNSVRPVTDPVKAVERAKLMFGCYRRDDAADPETYAAAVAAVLAEYSLEIVARVTDPRSGLPSRLQWLPTVKEVRDECEILEQRQINQFKAAAREREQLEARAREEWKAKHKPTLEELRAKYGPNWGLSESSASDDKLKARRREIMQKANQRAFVAECQDAGIDPAGGVSPSLIARLNEQRFT